MEETQGIVHHNYGDCAGAFCPFHNPSDHPLIDAPMLLRSDLSVPLIERICSHGIGHPDPDSLDYFQYVGVTDLDIHGCDGCCTGFVYPGLIVREYR